MARRDDEDWMGQLAAQDAYEQQAAQDAFAAFAARTQRSVMPEGGRTEAPGQILGPVVHALGEPIRKGQGLLQTMRDYSANEFPETMGAIAQTTDYDPRREAAGYAAGTAFNMLGAPAAVGGVPGMGMGIRAYHSSPHDFDRFDLSKLRTGQGANSYGKGFYLAENPAVSGRGGEYWQEFTRHPSITRTERDAAEFLALHDFNRQKAAQQVRAQLDRAAGGHPLSAEQLEFEKVVKLLESDKPVGARTYEVDIKAHPEQFLQWDKTLAEQPHIVEALPGIANAVKQEAYSRALSSTNPARADELWSLVKDPMQAPANFGVQQLQRDIGGEAMDKLRDAGIPGIRYADQGTRQTLSDLAAAKKAQQQMSSGGRKDWGAWGEEVERLGKSPQTYNYVVNDPTILDVTKKYGIPGLMLGGLAAQHQYEVQR